MFSRTRGSITSLLIGVGAYMFTDVVHEVLGHSIACLLQGNKITLLTSVYFRSTPPGIFTDLGGPMSNLVFALIIYFFLVQRKTSSPQWRLFLFDAMAYNLFLFSGTILQSPFSRTGDWTYAMMALDNGVSGKLILVVLGLAAYYVSIKIVRKEALALTPRIAPLSSRKSTYYSYFGAATAAFVGGLFFPFDPIHTAIGGLFEMIASLPILFAVTDTKPAAALPEIGRSWVVEASVLLLFVAFCLTLGRGFAF